MDKRLTFCTLIAIIVMIGGCHRLAPPEQGSQTEPFTFVQMCDTQLGFGGYEKDVKSFKQAVKQINALKPDFVVICGDLVNNPDDKSFADFNRIKSKLTVHCYCAPGNHDLLNKPTAASLKRYRKLIGKDYYTIKHKGYTIVVTNTQLWKAPLKGESEKHHAWVVKTLRNAKDRNSPAFIVGHYPLYFRSPEEGEHHSNFPLATRKELLALYKECGVIAVLAGHAHKRMINEYQGIQLVNGETTSVNVDKRPLGFRRWRVTSPKSVRHVFVPLKPDGAEQGAAPDADKLRR